MKTGVIVYVTNSGSGHDCQDMEAAINSLDIDADRVEVIAPDAGHFDIPDAWWSLTIKGMQRIVCMMGEITGPSSIRLTGRELRLCG